jgi:hypothetical protein
MWILFGWLWERFFTAIGAFEPAETKRGLPFSAKTTINLTALPVVLLLVVGLFFRS